MNNLAIFNFNSNEVRTVDRDGDVWFVAADVANVLGFRDANAMTRYLDADEKGTLNSRTLGGSQALLTISESGLYACVLKSRRDEAKAFRKWVTQDVLPSIRKTGRYDHEEFLRLKEENVRLLADKATAEANRDYWRTSKTDREYKKYRQGASEHAATQRKLAKAALTDLERVDKYVTKQRGYGFDDYIYRCGTEKTKGLLNTLIYGETAEPDFSE